MLRRSVFSLWLPIFIEFLAAVHASNAAASSQCRDLPPSTVRVFSMLPKNIEETLVSTKEMERMATASHLSELRIGPHQLLIDAQLGATVSVKHRPVKVRTDDQIVYCDAPELVDIGIGAAVLTASMDRRAASDLCIHRVFMQYAADRRDMLDHAIDEFIAKNQREIANRLQELKKTPATDPKSATTVFEAGLRSLVLPMGQVFAQRAMGSGEGSDANQRFLRLGMTCKRGGS